MNLTLSERTSANRSEPWGHLLYFYLGTPCTVHRIPYTVHVLRYVVIDLGIYISHQKYEKRDYLKQVPCIYLLPVYTSCTSVGTLYM